MIWKSCKSAHKEDNKIGFAFLRSVILYGFYNIQPLESRSEISLSQTGP
jgi:hypothetical protein